MVDFNHGHAPRPGMRGEPCCDVNTRALSHITVKMRGETVHEFETAYAMILRHHDDHVCGSVRIGCGIEMAQLLLAALDMAEDEMGRPATIRVLIAYLSNELHGDGA